MEYSELVQKIEHSDFVKDISIFGRTSRKYRILPEYKEDIPQLFTVNHNEVDTLVDEVAVWYESRLVPLLSRFHQIWSIYKTPHELFKHKLMQTGHDYILLKKIAAEFKTLFTAKDRPELMRLSYGRAEDIQRKKAQIK